MLQGLFAIPTGLFVGLHIFGVAIAMFVFGALAIWLGRRQFDGFTRSATICWGMLAMIAIAAGIAEDPALLRSPIAIILLGLLLATFGSVPLIAFIKQPCESHP